MPGRSIVLAVAIVAAMLPASSAAQMAPLFGPKQYTRRAGAPQTFHDSFAHCGTQACQIVIRNGNPNGSNRLSSASVYLNGVLIAGPSSFNQRVAVITRPVGLGGVNQLTVTLASNPGGFLTIEVDCTVSPVVLSLGNVGDSLLTPTKLATAAPIFNSGTAAAQNVTLTSITLTGGTLSSPSTPAGEGTIAAGSSALLNATFTGPFVPTSDVTLKVKGTYGVESSTYCFTISGDAMVQPAAPGSAPLGSVTVGSNTVTGAPFPPQPPDDEVEPNGPGWTVPNGPFVPGGPPPASTGVTPAPIGDPPGIVFNVNHDIGITSGVASTAEPSGASSGGVIFVSANKIAGYSTDGGSTFTALDPTKIFPNNDAIGFCCDQIVHYIPSIDRFVWLLQGANYQGYRLAVAKPADVINSKGTAWTYWNLPPSLFGTCTWVDYPDLALGDSFLYMSWDAKTGCTFGRQVVRTSFTGLQAGGTITLEYTDQSKGQSAWGGHMMQNTGNEAFWAGTSNSSTLRVFSLPENSTTYSWSDVTVATWANNTPLTVNTPDNQNWVAFMFNPSTQNPGGGFPNNAVLGATRVGNQLWFAWSAGTDNNFAQPHIEMVELDNNNSYAVLQQVQVWNSKYAFAYPALATNVCTNEIGMSFEYGGGGNYENHVVGFWGDFVAYQTTESAVGTTRFGDYVTIRQAPATDSNPGNMFDAFGYGINSESGVTTNDVHYVQFGRGADTCGSGSIH